MLMRGLTLDIDESPPTRSHKDAVEFHQRAFKNLAHVFKKARAMDTPSLKSIYDGTTTAPCAPDDLQLVELFKNFNDIAHAGLFAHPTKLSFKANSPVFLYGLDVGHCFMISINQARYNLILIVFI
jgi:hypothetical protein